MNIIAEFVEWARAQRAVRIYPDRGQTRGTIGRRRRQIAKGMLRIE